MSLSGFIADDLEPVVGTEPTAIGWRGITADGEILNVTSATGIPESIMVYAAGRPVGRRMVGEQIISIAEYLDAFNGAAALHRDCRDREALAAIDRAIAIVPTLRARFNRAMTLLSLGRWLEGFEEFELCEREAPFQRPRTAAALAEGLRPWRGEPLDGKRLLVIHDHGFGDAIMMLRFIGILRRHGAEIGFAVPPELRWICARFGDVVERDLRCDFFVSFLQLMRWLTVTPRSVPPAPYIDVDERWASFWRDRLGPRRGRRVGVAWSVNKDDPADFPRAVPLRTLVAMRPGEEFHSVQKQGAAEAEACGVRVHELADFAATAGLMANLDEIISVDTAAVHLAGAIGHPRVTLLLPRWHSWRWRGNPFYPEIDSVVRLTQASSM